MNHGTNFSGGSFSNEGNVRAPIQFRRETVLWSWPVKRKQTELFPHWNEQASSYPSLKYLLGQIQVQKPTLVVATDQISDQT